MKLDYRFSIIFVIFFMHSAYSQSGNIGVNTITPTNTLDINGTARIRDLNPNIYNPSIDKVIISDNTGVVKAVNSNILFTPTYQNLFDFSTLPVISIRDNNPSAVAVRTPLTIKSQTITLPKEALIQIYFSLPVTNVYGYGTSLAPVDGKAKILGTYLVVDDNIIIKSTNTYTNHTTGSGMGTEAAPLTGYFYNTGSCFIKLAAGTHTVRLEGTCNPYITCDQGGDFTGTRFQAVALFNQ